MNKTGDMHITPSKKLMNKQPTIHFAIPYEWGILEENLINYFIEKVVVMREVPLMKATYMLERENNMRRIQDKLSKIGPLTGFASKQGNKKML